MPDPCFICGEDMAEVTVRPLTVLGSLRVRACGPCVDLPDTPEYVDALLVERLGPATASRTRQDGGA